MRIKMGMRMVMVWIMRMTRRSMKMIIRMISMRW